jgi:hypothetical protein
MTDRDRSVVIAAAGAVIGVLGVAVAAVAIVISIARTHDDRKQLDVLQRRLQTLCERQLVTHVRLDGNGRILVETEKGC